MRKLNKLISAVGFSLSSLFYSPSFSQVKTIIDSHNQTWQLWEDGRLTTTATYNGESKTYTHPNTYNPKLYELYKDSNGAIYPKSKSTNTPKSQTTQGKSSSSTYQVSPNKTITEKKYTPNKSNTGKNYPAYKNTNKKNSDLNNALNTALVIGGAALILNELFKPRQKTYVYPTQPIDNSPAQPINKSPSESSWDWQTKKSENVKSVDEDFWGEIKDRKLESKKIANERSKELSDFVEKQMEYSPETKKLFDEEVKKADEFYKEFYRTDPKAYAEAQKLDDLHKVISYNAYQLAKDYTAAGPVMEGMERYNELEEKGIENFWKDEIKKADEYFKERGMNPGEQVKYKIVGTAEMGPDGKLIKKNSQSPERKITDEEKVILYYTYKAAKNYTQTGPVIKGVETINKFEKEDSNIWWDK